jgi:hypothetical protein
MKATNQEVVEGAKTVSVLLDAFRRSSILKIKNPPTNLINHFVRNPISDAQQKNFFDHAQTVVVKDTAHLLGDVFIERAAIALKEAGIIPVEETNKTETPKKIGTFKQQLERLKILSYFEMT